MIRQVLRTRAAKLLVAAGSLTLTLFMLGRAGSELVVSVPLDAPDAILALGSHEWERLPDVAAAARRNPAALVLLTVPRTPSIHNCHDCEGRVGRLVAEGVAADRIVKLSQTVSNTREEAAAARLDCERRGLRRLLVVTSPYHTRRALATFRHAFAGSGVAVGILPSAASPARPQSWWRAPYDRAYVRYEWAATVYYWLLGIR